MSLFANCPLPAGPSAITKQICGVNYGQVVKMAFWIKGQTPFTKTTIGTAAAWSTATAATGAGKVIVTNYLNNFTIPNGEIVEQAADTNINAIPELQRGATVAATFNSRSLGATNVAELKTLTPFTQIQPGVSNLVFVMITADGNVLYNDNGTDLGFNLYNFFISDTDITPALGALNMIAGRFYLTYGWADKLAVITPAFDLLNSYPAGS